MRKSIDISVPPTSTMEPEDMNGQLLQNLLILRIKTEERVLDRDVRLSKIITLQIQN